ncbi:SAM-dependent methyltransferase [Paraburkholderia sp. BL6665CI2N2]|uniref:class I SAM-dependent methyltransferase n=1 Tax=Paraburkholderia sp. BL6665CI2N2 TaxID=1938806 RepID=UPI001066991A|nr:class I SAM-dependent methyltransferase [Paraburkholderia sp. BL6665CI2N2]TDY25511.1 SAM-dependent methyltransferase [Paraburkholderia sp. BL6665CI2N2]
MNTRNFLKKILRPNGKMHFLSQLQQNASILDVGCGNNSPFDTKNILPNSHYTGLDIGDYNQIKPNKADSYILSTPENFSNEISMFTNEFDAVISAHNIEHCDDRLGTFQAMLKSLKPGGKIFLSFPCEQSKFFPKRAGTLNYYDDPTHKYSPPDFDSFLVTLKDYNFQIIFATKNYKSTSLWVLGLLIEPISKIRNRVMLGTWEFYGFESIIIAKKLKPTRQQL